MSSGTVLNSRYFHLYCVSPLPPVLRIRIYRLYTCGSVALKFGLEEIILLVSALNLGNTITVITFCQPKLYSTYTITFGLLLKSDTRYRTYFLLGSGYLSLKYARSGFAETTFISKSLFVNHIFGHIPYGTGPHSCTEPIYQHHLAIWNLQRLPTTI